MLRRDTRIVEIHPVTPDRWSDLVDLFERPGPRGAWPRTSACYCMFWRLPPTDYDDGFRQRSLDNVSGGPNKEAMEEIVKQGTMPGLLAFREGEPIGWVAVSPREALVRPDHVRTFDSADEHDDERVWSISCFYVHRSEWRNGVGSALLESAIARAAEHGATMIEGYPVKAGSIDPYTGYDTMFAAKGFERRQPGRGKGRALWRKSLSG
jgi:GNAT superfamily N-acetyltransferase